MDRDCGPDFGRGGPRDNEVPVTGTTANEFLEGEVLRDGIRVCVKETPREEGVGVGTVGIPPTGEGLGKEQTW